MNTFCHRVFATQAQAIPQHLRLVLAGKQMKGVENCIAMQAEEERRMAAEEAARQEAEAEEGDPAVAQMRRVLGKTKSGAKVAEAVKQLEVEGGLAGKWKVLYEVSLPSQLMPGLTSISLHAVCCMCWCCRCLLHLLVS